MFQHSKWLLLALTLTILTPGNSAADVVVFNNGTRIAGTIKEEGDQVVITTMDGNALAFDKKSVKEIIPEAKVRQEYKERLEKIKKDDVAALLQLAGWAIENGLPDEAKKTLEMVLKVDPDHKRAKQWLQALQPPKEAPKEAPKENDAPKLTDEEYQARGYTRHEKRWVLDFAQKDKWKLITEEERKQLGRHGWEVLSPHYHLKTDAPPEKAAELMTLLEEVYRQFYEEFRKDLDLKDVSTPMRIDIHASERGYLGYAMRRFGPSARGTMGFFNHRDPLLVTFVQNGLERQLMHEGFHQLMFHSFGISHNEHSTWFHEGIGRYFEYSQWDGAKVARRGGYSAKDVEILKKALEAGRYPRLKEMVGKNFTKSHFDNHFAVCYAFSATYVDFLLHYENGKYRKGFCAYFPIVKDHEESVENFEKALGGVKTDDLQKEWEKWVKEIIAREDAKGEKKSDNKADGQKK